jgi:coproporphyrinogen III oxidase
MPPVVRWETDHEVEPGTDEHRLLHEFLVPRDWADVVPPTA